MIPTRLSSTAAALAVLAVAAPCSAALAADPLGLYVGAGIGAAQVRADDAAFGSSLGFVEHDTAWKAIAGFRPLPLLGAELEYIDFGRPRRTTGPRIYPTTVAAGARAAAAFAVLHLPIPLPLVGVYAKAGVARIATTVRASAACAANGCRAPVLYYRNDRTDQQLAYGAGVELKFAGLALRWEYERASRSGGDPDVASLAITWSF